MMENKKEVVITGDQKEGAVGEHHPRDEWSSPLEFIFSCLGYAVGYGNVWRFPFLCFKNGGAAFLIPYTVMLLIAGIPMFFMELSLGQYVSLGPNVVFAELSPLFTGVGYAMLVTSGITGIYYNLLLAWTFFYTFASFTSELPWSTCDNDFNTEKCFTYSHENKCKEQNLLYYNNTCLDIEEYCAISSWYKLNSTHCHNGTVENPIHYKKAVKRISASEEYFNNRMLGVQETSSWDDLGQMRWELVGCMILAWTVVCICMIKGIKSTGKVVYVTATFPYLVLLILFIRGLTLEGYYKGIEFYILKPNMTKLQEVEVWTDAAGQIFFSLSVAYGGLITLSSYNKFNNNCMRDAIMISLLNCGTSVFAGFVIFSILGFMAHDLGLEVDEVAKSGSGLAFIAYPEAVTRMPVSPLWAILFFLMLITLGLDSQFVFVEVIATGIFDKFPHLRAKKSLVMIGVSVVLFLLGLVQCTQGGILMFELLNHYASGLSIIFIAICEVIAVGYIYGFKRFMKNITEEMGVHVPAFFKLYWGINWLVLTPISLVLILVFSLIDFQLAKYAGYLFPDGIQALGILTILASVLCVPVLGLVSMVSIKRAGRKMAEVLWATDDFAPAHVRSNAKANDEVNNVFKYVHSNEGFVQDVTFTSNNLTSEKNE